MNDKPSHSSNTIIKILALLSLVRWYNVLLIGIALFLTSLFLLRGDFTFQQVLTDTRLYFQIIAVSLFLQAGYLINAFYDYEKDIINRPEETIFGRIVSKRTCLNTYVVLILLGLGVSFLLGGGIFLANFFFSFLLWYYSHRLRKINFLGEITASLLAIYPFVVLTLIYPYVTQTFILYGGFIFIVTFTREVLKKMVSLKGDLIVGEQSIPIVLGIKSAKYILLLLILITLVLIFYFLPGVKHDTIFYFFIFISCLLGGALYKLYQAKTPKDFDKINTIYKIIIGTSIFSVVLLK